MPDKCIEGLSPGFQSGCNWGKKTTTRQPTSLGPATSSQVRRRGRRGDGARFARRTQDVSPSRLPNGPFWRFGIVLIGGQGEALIPECFWSRRRPGTFRIVAARSLWHCRWWQQRGQQPSEPHVGSGRACRHEQQWQQYTHLLPIRLLMSTFYYVEAHLQNLQNFALRAQSQGALGLSNGAGGNQAMGRMQSSGPQGSSYFQAGGGYVFVHSNLM